MKPTSVASKDDWLRARLELLEKEKAHTRARNELTRARQALPWVPVEKDYIFQGSEGEESLSDLFGGMSQLIVYHFMFAPDWDEGCKSCSFLMEHCDRSAVHLAQRDTALVAVSRAALQKLHEFRDRMGWNFKWVSSGEGEFNYDYHVSFTDAELASGGVHYNFRDNVAFGIPDAPGVSTFVKDDEGRLYHTYSSYGRGLEGFITAYDLLDIVPKGRDEDSLPYGMAWVRLKDRYGDASYIDPYA